MDPLLKFFLCLAIYSGFLLLKFGLLIKMALHKPNIILLLCIRSKLLSYLTTFVMYNMCT